RRWRTSGTESRMHVSCLYFFFLQAEDGIRDFHVTGVQTCALPIYDAPALASADLGMAVGSGAHVAADAADLILVRDELTVVPDRSGERRGGKAGKPRRAADPWK